jgi:uncharacterized protein
MSKKLEYRSVTLTDIKAKEDEPGKFAGRASVYGVVDSYGDVVMPGAFTKHLQASGNRIKVLAQHDPSDVIGLATLSDKIDALWIEEAKLVLDLPSAKDMYTRLTNGLIDGISIGYEVMPGGATFNKQGIRELHDIKLWEVSLVTWPANAFSLVTDVKSDGRDELSAQIERLAGAAVALKNAIEVEQKAGAKFSKENAALIVSAYDVLAKLRAQVTPEDEDEKARKAQSEIAESLARELGEVFGTLSL